MELILASGSRYRRELLERLLLPFRVQAPDVDERPRAGEGPRAMALRLAREKADVIARIHPDAVVIGSDQVATHDGVERIGKPGTVEQARAQLRLAAGRAMVFHTAYAVLAPGRAAQVDCVDTRVVYRRLSDAEIARYVEREPALDCAGAARCEALGISLLQRIESDDPTALIGLPLIRVAAALRAVGLDPLAGGGPASANRATR